MLVHPHFCTDPLNIYSYNATNTVFKYVMRLHTWPPPDLHTQPNAHTLRRTVGGPGKEKDEKKREQVLSSQGLSCCLAAVCSLQWVAIVSLSYLRLFIIAQSLVGGSHLRVLGICWLQVISKDGWARLGPLMWAGYCCGNPCPFNPQRADWHRSLVFLTCMHEWKSRLWSHAGKKNSNKKTKEYEKIHHLSLICI